jgi:hypothetical protein
MVEMALAKAGITSERVSAWLGRPCHCGERKDRLNALSFWAAAVVENQIQEAKEILDRIISDCSPKGGTDGKH